MERETLLRAAAASLAGAAFLGANAYVLAHPKNPAAPLQPPVAEAIARPSPSPSPSPTSHRASERQTPRPTPRITLQPAVRETSLPGIAFTHVS